MNLTNSRKVLAIVNIYDDNKSLVLLPRSLINSFAAKLYTVVFVPYLVQYFIFVMVFSFAYNFHSKKYLILK